MKTTSVALGPHFEDFIQASILSGRYNNASEVVRSGLRLLEDQEQKIAALRTAIEEGMTSGCVEDFDSKAYLQEMKDTWSETQADKYYQLLENAMDEIGSNPQKTGKPYDEIITGLKGYHAGKHLVFYIIQENSRAFIVRILHEKMDYKRHF